MYTFACTATNCNLHWGFLSLLDHTDCGRTCLDQQRVPFPENNGHNRHDVPTSPQARYLCHCSCGMMAQTVAAVVDALLFVVEGLRLRITKEIAYKDCQHEPDRLCTRRA